MAAGRAKQHSDNAGRGVICNHAPNGEAGGRSKRLHSSHFQGPQHAGGCLPGLRMQARTDAARGKRPLWPYSAEQSIHTFISNCLLSTAISYVHLSPGTHSWAHARCCCVPDPWPKKDSGPGISREGRHEWEKANEAGKTCGLRAGTGYRGLVGSICRGCWRHS